MPFKIIISVVGRSGHEFSGQVDRYVRMIRPFLSMEVDYIRPVTGNNAMPKEERLLLSRRPDNSYSIAMSAEGTMFDSSGFAQWMQQRMLSGKTLSFAVGGASGLTTEFKRDCDQVISLSRMTMQHSIALLVLVEQLYRACTILKGHPYNK